MQNLNILTIFKLNSIDIKGNIPNRKNNQTTVDDAGKRLSKPQIKEVV
ncbi:hypothetical protein [Chitinophaga sp.]